MEKKSQTTIALETHFGILANVIYNACSLLCADMDKEKMKLVIEKSCEKVKNDAIKEIEWIVSNSSSSL